MQVEPFRIAVSDAALDALRQRLARTRFPDEIHRLRLGVRERARVHAPVGSVLEGPLRWRAAERGLKAFPQFRADIGELGIHFIHQPGRQD